MHPNGDRYTGEAHHVAEADKREEWILTPGDSKLAACTSSVADQCGDGSDADVCMSVALAVWVIVPVGQF